MPDAPTRPMFPELLEEGLEPYEVPHLWLSSNEPDTYVDITDTMETKLASLREHASQGAADAEKWVRERARELGLQADCEYAEGFKVFRFIDEDEEEQA